MFHKRSVKLKASALRIRARALHCMAGVVQLEQPPKLKVQVLTQDRYGQKVELRLLKDIFAHGSGTLWLLARVQDLLAQQTKMWLVRHEAEHDEVRVESVYAMHLIGIIAGLLFARTDQLHDLVLALAGSLLAGKDHFDSAPGRIAGQFAVDEPLEMCRQTSHELRAGRDAVGVEHLAREL